MTPKIIKIHHYQKLAKKLQNIKFWFCEQSKKTKLSKIYDFNDIPE